MNIFPEHEYETLTTNPAPAEQTKVDPRPEYAFFRAAVDLDNTVSEKDQPAPVAAASVCEEEMQAPAPREAEISAKETETPVASEPKTEDPQVKSPVTENSYYQPKLPEKKAGSKKSSIPVAAVLAGVLVLVLVGCLITAGVMNRQWENRYQEMTGIYSQQIQQLQSQIDENNMGNAATGNSVSGTPSATGEGLTPSQVYAQNVNAVVAISSTVTGGTSTGSGFIMTEDGYVVTNYHVVEGARKIQVITTEGQTYLAKLIGYDQTNDVAVLKVEATGLPYVTVGSSDALIVGDQVVAIGNPLGELTNTLTVGYVSAKERSVTTDGITISMLQTDAAINSGNSGGPLFNMKGEVVGITTAKYSGESSSGATIEGIGFAIPIDDVYDLIEDLITDGYVSTAYLGVMVSEINADYADYYGVPMGTLVKEVTPGFCAEEAGIQVDDIIVGLGTYKITGLSTLSRALRSFEPGDTTTITVWRDGEEVVLTITLDAKPQEEAAQPEIEEEIQGLPENGSFEDWYEYFKDIFGDRD